MDDPACQMYLIAGDDRHLLREGITLIGSADNDRYSCIRLSDKSICGKHAALRWSAATLDLHVMDLCSHGGTQLTGGLDQSTTTQEISPLEWHRAASDGAIVFGSFKARFESSPTRTRKRSTSFFDDSADIVDCSLEEAPQTKSRTEPKKIVQSTSLPSASASQIKDASFMIPATQPADTSTTTPNASIRQPANASHTVAGGGPANTTEDDDDDMFFIPETQEQIQTSVAEESQIIEPIIGRTTAKEDDDFLRFETMDDENTGDGMFNNPYVEQSQNLLHNLDESYKRDMAGADQRKSILPDRSVDSISFHGKLPVEATDDELSKIEWNETKNTDQEQEQEREGSVTPELDFDKPVARGSDVRNPMLDTLLTEEPRVESVTPDLEFDRITPQQKEVSGNASKLSLMKCVISPTADLEKEPKGQEQSITPDMDFEEQPPEEAEISLNQEGAEDPYDLATQPILVDKFEPAATFKAPSSPYDLPTQTMPEEEIRAARPLKKLTVGLINLKSSMKDVSIRANKQIELNPFDLATQPLPKNDQADIYDLQTQHLPHSADDTVPFDLPPPSTSKVKRKSSTARPPPRKSLGQPDPFEIATQPLPLEDSNALYDLQTQVLPENDQNDTIPLDIPALPTTDDAYDLQTQPLIGQNSASSVVGDDADDAEITQNFRPKVNSTYRQSLLVKQLDPIAEDREKDKDDADISPSSNKENREDANPPRDQSKLAAVRLKSRSLTHSDNSKSHLDGDEELDEEYCLAATLPMGDGSSKDSSASASAKASGSKRSKRSDRKQDKKPVFKKPDTSAASSTKSSLPSGFETPRSRQSSTSGTVDTDTFDFNTPEHPFLDVVKKEKILAISDMIMSRPSRAESLAKRNKYIFGDSSDEDEDPTAPVFQKEDSKIRVMKYDKDDNGTREEKPVPVASAAPERRSNRSKKKNSRYSDDEEEKPKTKIKTIKESPPVVPPKPVKKVDESVDYEPPANKKTRKRKAAEEKPAPVVELPPPPPPAIKASSKSKKAGSSSASSAEIEEKPVVAPKRSKKPVVESKKPTIVEVSSEDEHTNASGTDSSSSGTRKSSRASKPRLMFTKMSPEPYRRMITRAGGLIVDLPELASVLVSDRVYRTYKFLCAIAKGIPIVGEAFLEATKTHRDFVDPWDYILQDHEMERRFKFNLKKSLSLAREAKIFQDYSVIVTPSTKPPPEEVQLIVSSAGGRVIKFPAQQPNHAEKLFAVSDLQDKDLWPRFRERYPTIEIISTEGFMLSIMQHYKNFRSYRLT